MNIKILPSENGKYQKKFRQIVSFQLTICLAYLLFFVYNFASVCLHYFSDEETSIYGAKAILYQDVDACEDSDDEVEEISSKWGKTRLDDNISDTASTISSTSSEIGNKHALEKYDQFSLNTSTLHI